MIWNPMIVFRGQRTVCERKDGEWKRIKPDLEPDPALLVYTRLSEEEIAAGIPPRTILIKICFFMSLIFRINTQANLSPI